MLSRRQFLIQGSLGAVAVGAAAALRTVGHTARAAATTDPAALPNFVVTDYGAFPNGSDATPGFQAAVNAAQANPGGGIVSVPEGTFVFSSETVGYISSILIHGTNKVYLQGSGTGSTTLLEQVPGQSLISVTTDGTNISDLTLDCKTFTGGSCLIVSANNTLLMKARALGSKAQKAFTLFYAGPPGASTNTTNIPTNRGNQIIDCDIADEIEDDGISFSFQSGGAVSGCTHFGSRLAIYACNNVTVSDYSYSPNPACNVTRSVTDGYYITAPSESIAITNFTTSGQGGIISGSAATKKSCTDITIVNEVFTAPVGGNRIEIGAVDGLTITGGSFVNGTAQNSLYFAPAAPVSNVVVQGQGDTPLDLSDVRFLPQGHGATIEVTFENVSFPPLLIPPAGSPGALGSPSPTFRNLGGAGPPAPQVTVNGGMFTNTAVGAGFSQGVFQSPANTANYTITAYALNLGQAPVNLVAPQITTGSPPIVPNTTLTALKGAWSTAEEGSDTNTYSFQWSNQSGPVAGQTSPTYQVQIGDTTVTVTVTAANKDNPSLSASAASVPVTVS